MMLLLLGVTSCLLIFVGGNLSVEKRCPVNAPRVECKADPCRMSTGCRAYPLAECRSNYCGGCNAEYFVQNKKVNCSVCPSKKPVLQCMSACMYAKPAPGFTCVPDFCGSTCSMKFVKLCKDGSRPVQCFYEPCALALCPAGHTCVSNYCRGCNAECVPSPIG
ncbi:keratin-associated protein 10-6-like [Liolophura sinensis]|uniref:keratin-associated protein 10-6-like n=1 Tax=Liolophura sinensis TaxID=3198878 RepID=UPI0031580127